MGKVWQETSVKVPWTKQRGVGLRVGGGCGSRAGESDRGKMETTILEQQYKKVERKIK